MRYVGSKAAHAGAILAVIERTVGPLKQRVWVEPFVGGGNMLCRVEARSRLGGDSNADVILLLDALATGWAPPLTLSERDYEELRHAGPSALRSFAGFCCSFGGKWFGGYARAPGTTRDLTNEGARNILKQSETIHTNVSFKVSSYDNLPIPPCAVIYCDPPYQGTQGYGGSPLDYKDFWGWCDLQVREGHDVFVSEYKAPPHWTEVWSKPVKNTLDRNTGGKAGVERLFHRRLGCAQALDDLITTLRGEHL